MKTGIVVLVCTFLAMVLAAAIFLVPLFLRYSDSRQELAMIETRIRLAGFRQDAKHLPHVVVYPRTELFGFLEEAASMHLCFLLEQVSFSAERRNTDSFGIYETSIRISLEGGLNNTLDYLYALMGSGLYVREFSLSGSSPVVLDVEVLVFHEG